MAKVEVLEQAKEFYNKLTNQQKIIGWSVIGSMLIGFIILMIATGGKEEWSVLYSSLEEKDAAQITAKLKEKNIEYELSDNGTTILVPSNVTYDVRLDMANEGLPESGVAGYEIFDKTNLGMSERVQKLNERRALEGEITKTIQANDQIKKVRVHIVLPENTLFEKDQKKPTASIVLTLKSQRSLSKINVDGIQNLVAGSIEGMSPEDVIVVDNRGKILSHKSAENNTVAGLTAQQYDQVTSVEEHYKQKVQSMLDGVLGVNNSEVRVTAELDFNQKERTITKYEESGDYLVSRQEIKDEANEIARPQDSNLAVDMKKGQSNLIENYEVPKTVTKEVDEVGDIERLSVAVVVNGKDSVIQDEGGNPKIINVPLTQGKIDTLKWLVEKAIGIDQNRDDKIVLHYYPFVPYDEEKLIADYYQKQIWNPKWWEETDKVKLIGLPIAIILVLIIIFSLLKSKYIKDRIRIALSLPETVKVEDDEVAEEEVEEEELEEIMIEDDDLMLVPAELPDQLLLEWDKQDREFDELTEEEEEFNKDSLAARAKASLSEGEAEDITEDAMMKLELKNKVEGFVAEQPSEAVKLVRFFLAQDMEKSSINL